MIYQNLFFQYIMYYLISEYVEGGLQRGRIRSS